MQQSLHWLNRPFAELIRLAWPIAVSTLSYSLMTVVDTLFVSGIGPSALAGVGLAGVSLFTALCFGMGLLRGVKILVSQAIGADRRGDVGAYTSAGMAIALVLGALSVVLAEVAAPLVARMAASVEAGEHTIVYLRLRALGAPAMLFFVALRESRYGQGDARTPMVATVIGNLGNIFLDYVFVVHCGWGVAGVAWASVVANFIEAGLLIGIQRAEVVSLPRPESAHVASVWRVGVPTGGQFLLEVGAFTLLTVMISAMSEVEMAAHQLVLHLMHFAFLPANAVAEAGSVMAGQAVGADRDDLVVGVARRSLIVAGIYASLCTLVAVLFAPTLMSWFTEDADLAASSVRLAHIAALFLIFDSANMVARAVLRGTADVRFAAVVCIAAAWLLTPPITWLLGYQLGLGAAGGWFGLCAEIVASAAILWWRLLRGGWRPAAARSRAEVRGE